ncbi:hypothetical protein [Azohydromonas aeria]|uniref:hypothetical protein n=1 Tax=Azohydromonas aeria TaxID=2590212 RepID=UPI0012FBFDB4|nr:hypothetical protein [Azohydromonas aeria]
MKSAFHTKPAAPSARSETAGQPIPRFVKVGQSDGHPVPDLQQRLEAFYAKYPESRRTLRKGQPGSVELVKEARDRR